MGFGMAFNPKYEIQAYDRNGVLHVVQFITDFDDPVTYLECDNAFNVYRIESGELGADEFEPIRDVNARVNLLLTDVVKDMLDEILDSDFGDWLLNIERGGNTLFKGIIDPGIVEYEDDINTAAYIRANSGLLFLDTVPFKTPIVTEGFPYDLIGFVAAQFSQLPFLLDFTIQGGLLPEDVSTAETLFNSLHSLSPGIWVDADTGNPRPESTSLKTIQDILAATGHTITQDKGRWLIYSAKNYTSATMQHYYFNSFGVYESDDTVSIVVTYDKTAFISHQTAPVVSTRRPVQDIRIEYAFNDDTHFQNTTFEEALRTDAPSWDLSTPTYNILQPAAWAVSDTDRVHRDPAWSHAVYDGDGEGEQWSMWIEVESGLEHPEDYVDSVPAGVPYFEQNGDVVSPASGVLRFRFFINLDPAFYVWARIKVGEYYWDANTGQWVTSEVVVRCEQDADQMVLIETTPPASNGVVEFRIYGTYMYYDPEDPPENTTSGVFIDGFSFEADYSTRTFITRVYQNRFGSTRQIRTVLIGDGPSPVSGGRLSGWDGLHLQPTSTWQGYGLSGIGLHELVCTAQLYAQANIRRVVSYAFLPTTAYLELAQGISFSGKKWMPVFSFLEVDKFGGQYVEVRNDVVDTNVVFSATTDAAPVLSKKRIRVGISGQDYLIFGEKV